MSGKRGAFLSSGRMGDGQCTASTRMPWSNVFSSHPGKPVVRITTNHQTQRMRVHNVVASRLPDPHDGDSKPSVSWVTAFLLGYRMQPWVRRSASQNADKISRYGYQT